MLCKECRYSLETLATHRCPECGASFDPDDPSTFVDEVAIKRVDRHVLKVMIGVMAAVYIFVLIVGWIAGLVS